MTAGLLAGCGTTDANNDPVEIPDPRVVADSLYTTLEGGLKIYDFDIGTGTQVVPDGAVELHYIVWLQNGTFVDSSYLRGRPLVALLGREQLVEGFEEGLKGMRVGGYRQIVVPPEMGYGSEGNAGIPPNSTLIFEVALLGVGFSTQ